MQSRSVLFTTALLFWLSLFSLVSHAQSDIVTIERFVPHVSTAPANNGQRVGIYLRERYSVAAADRWESGQSREGHVVLFVHGGSVSSIPDYDLDYKDYSWMEYLAEAGFDTFAMDHTGLRALTQTDHGRCLQYESGKSAAGYALSAERTLRTFIQRRIVHRSV